jgi:hypothetical protein
MDRRKGNEPTCPENDERDINETRSEHTRKLGLSWPFVDPENPIQIA